MLANKLIILVIFQAKLSTLSGSRFLNVMIRFFSLSFKSFGQKEQRKISKDVVFLSENENSDAEMVITTDPEPCHDHNIIQ